jgi:hypothetical protein
MRHLSYNVRYSVVPINSSLLSIILYPSVRTTLVSNNTYITSRYKQSSILKINQIRVLRKYWRLKNCKASNGGDKCVPYPKSAQKFVILFDSVFLIETHFFFTTAQQPQWDKAFSVTKIHDHTRFDALQ